MPSAPAQSGGEPGSRGLPITVLRFLRDLCQRLESALPELERAQYWTGRRLWHAERRYREDTRQQEWELRQTLDAARNLNNAVILAAQAVTGAIRLADSIFEFQQAAQSRGYYVDRGSGVNLIYDPLGNDVSTQTPYLWPEELGGYSDRLDPALRGRSAGSAGVSTLIPIEHFDLTQGSESSDADEELGIQFDNFWSCDGRR